MFDEVIGYLRDSFDDDAIYISADHGNMNGKKGKICYGFDVYQPAINIPLITPRIKGLPIYNKPVSNVHMYDILNDEIPDEDFIYSDTAYYGQPYRKLTIIHGRFKYIYNKATNIEELYDLEYDPHEECNIINKVIVDVDRGVRTPLDQVYYYPFWDEAEKEKELLRTQFRKIWKTTNSSEHLFANFKYKISVKFPKLVEILAPIQKIIRK